MPKIAEVKSSSCGLQKKLQLRNCGVAVAEQNFSKSCGLAIAEVLSSGCGIAIANSKKSCACPPLSVHRRPTLLIFNELEYAQIGVKFPPSTAPCTLCTVKKKI